MASRGMIRPLKSGGFSICRCPEELVGKGRCQHLLGFASVVWNDKDELSMVDMSGHEIKEDNYTQYIDSVSNSLSAEKKASLAKFFQDHDI